MRNRAISGESVHLTYRAPTGQEVVPVYVPRKVGRERGYESDLHAKDGILMGETGFFRKFISAATPAISQELPQDFCKTEPS